MSKSELRLLAYTLNLVEQYQHFSEVTRKSLRHALEEHDLSLNDQDSEKLMDTYYNLSTFPEVNKALRQLETNPDMECLAFSNGTRTMVFNSMNKSTDLHSSVFTNLITVDEVRLFKPVPEA